MKAVLRILASAIFAALAGANAYAAEVCATPGKDSVGIGVTGVINTYFPGTPAQVASVGVQAAGTTSVILGQSQGASTAIASGDLLLFIQMQDAQFDTSNDNSYGDGISGGLASGITAINQTGVYEFARATGPVALTGGTLTFTTATGGLVNTYYDDDADGTRGQRRFQVIRVPQYSNLSIGAGLTAFAWNGKVGGVLVVDVAARLDLNGGVMDVSAMGFRGGAGRKITGLLGSITDYATSILSLNTHGEKGEGIGGTPNHVFDLVSGLLSLLGVDTIPGGSSARGAPGDAGGGGMDASLFNANRNSGGGGGAGYGNGGGGGYATCPTAPVGCAQNGGHGGSGVTGVGAARILLGGGGGAGSNDSGSGLGGAGLGSSGATGGGIVIIRAGVVAGAGTIRANGGSANTVGNDGAGGGGGGGSILFLGRTLEAGASILTYAKGGTGGSTTGSHGPGGGGGGGFIASTLASVAADVSAGSNGLTVDGGAYGAAYGAVSGLTGGTALGAGISITGVLSGYDCAPVLDKVFETTKITLGLKTRLKVTLTNHHASASITGAAFLDTYPSGMINAPVPNISTTCGGTVTAAAGTNTLQVISASVAAAASCSVWVDVLPQNSGSFLNTINAGGLVANLLGSVVQTLFAAQGSCDVIEPLTAVKSAVTLSDPSNGATNPKSIPGAVVEYSIAVTNPSTDTPANVVVGDAIPANASLIVTDIGAAGSGPVSFTQGSPSSALSYVFTSLASTTDGLEFSNNNGSTWTYAPMAGVGGVDATVTNVRATLTGNHAAGGKFTLKFRVKVK